MVQMDLSSGPMHMSHMQDDMGSMQAGGGGGGGGGKKKRKFRYSIVKISKIC
jgi:hypothetical protein